MNDIFDLNNLNDIPMPLRNSIKETIVKKETMQDKIMSLFKIKSSLSIGEIVVGFYRKYKIERTKNQMICLLHSLVNKNKIIRENKTQWIIKDE